MRCAALLKNIHQVMKAEDVLHGAKLFCDLVPVPRDIGSDCGMAVVVECDAVDTTLAMLADVDLNVLALYRIVDDGYEMVFDRRSERG